MSPTEFRIWLREQCASAPCTPTGIPVMLAESTEPEYRPLIAALADVLVLLCTRPATGASHVATTA